MSEEKRGPPVWVLIIVLVPFVLAGIGVVSALAIYGVRKYLVNAKQAEAQAALIQWGDGLVRCGESNASLPPSTTPIPASLSDVAGKKYLSAPTEWRERAHVCAGFAITTPQYFQYSWKLRGANEGVLHAQADWDGDGSPDAWLEVPITCSAGKCARGTATGLDGAAVSGASTARGSPNAASSESEVSWIFIVFIVLCMGGILVGSFWTIGLAFTESMGWGLIALLVPFGRLVFVIKHWEIAKRPFFVGLASGGAMVFGGVFYGVAIGLAAGHAKAASAEPSAPTVEPTPTRIPAAPTASPIPALDGTAVDLSTVMGRARKLANQWQPDAALLGIEATLTQGKIQTQDGATAKLTFGPSPFVHPPTHAGLFVVIYDQSGIHGAPAPGKPGPVLPEPMCAPERVLWPLRDAGGDPITLSYALDESRRPTWLAGLSNQPQRLRAFDPHDCKERGMVAVRPKQ